MLEALTDLFISNSPSFAEILHIKKRLWPSLLLLLRSTSPSSIPFSSVIRTSTACRFVAQFHLPVVPLVDHSPASELAHFLAFQNPCSRHGRSSTTFPIPWALSNATINSEFSQFISRHTRSFIHPAQSPKVQSDWRLSIHSQTTYTFSLAPSSVCLQLPPTSCCLQSGPSFSGTVKYTHTVSVPNSHTPLRELY